nr:ionotropic receptor 40a [Drosophila kikkawai]
MVKFNAVFGLLLYTRSAALSQIISGLRPRPLAILALPGLTLSNKSCQDDPSGIQVNDFLQQLHQLYYKSVIFNDTELFFHHVEKNLHGAIECVNLILDKPKEILLRLRQRRLAHRLSLFIFYWGARWPPSPHILKFEEPMRVVVVTRPRHKAFRIYYNQARPGSESQLRLVNWYDGDNLGLQRIPLLPAASSVYANFEGRVFTVPVFHSPPWFWVTYGNNSSDTDAELLNLDSTDYNEMRVTGGRDHRLLMLLAQHMNFRFKYVEAPGRTQGSLRSDDAKELNDTFTGGIGLLQSGQADFFLGDVGLSWERRKAIEFSFFTLADSGAFATHAPRRLNEALAIMRPFKKDIWPYLILTIVFSGPIFYGIITMPYIWRRHHANLDVEQLRYKCIYMTYIKEITPGLVKVKRRKVKVRVSQQIPNQLFEKCIWFTLRLFLKQSCQELYHGYRAKFLTIVYWIAATYVLADVYSAQLTSQFARPARETPIDTLQRLQAAMIRDGYSLYVEKESSSLEMLENGTELFRHLYALMRQQHPDGRQSFLIDSVEAGIQLIAKGGEDKAVLGGRETLYFNIQQYGAQNFQLSHKLYTRYSAVAVQIGCPFLDSLNDVLMHLFEGGILEKITSAEYAAQSRKIPKDKVQQSTEQTTVQVVKDTVNEKSNGVRNHSPSQSSEVISPLNLRMLQGAFIVLGVGSLTAGSIFLLEIVFRRLAFVQKIKHLWLHSLRQCFKNWGRFLLWTERVFAPRWRNNRN